MTFPKKEIKILSIGNSYSEDAFSYLPFIFKTLVSEVDLTFGICHFPSCTLKQHCDFFINKKPVYVYYKCKPNDTAWTHYTEKTNLFAIEDENWDIIILQQQSFTSQNYGTYEPYIHMFTEYIFNSIKKPVKLLWHLTPSYGQNPDGGAEMFANTALCAKRVLQETPFEGIIPCGTAIQNARNTSLSQIGDNKNLSSNYHTQEGLGCQIEAYTAILSITNLLGLDYISILGDRTVTDMEWFKDKNIPGPDGEPTGSELKNLLLAQKCAIAAIKNPFSVTYIKE